jgi:hypothetical protein
MPPQKNAVAYLKNNFLRQIDNYAGRYFSEVKDEEEDISIYRMI